MNTRLERWRNGLFFGTMAAFGFATTAIIYGFRRFPAPMVVLSVLAAALFLLGGGVMLLTSRLGEAKWRKVFFLTAGISAAGIPVAAVLHNLVYGLMIWLSGKSPGEGGGDEAVFFILAVLVLPLTYLAGTAGAIVSLVRNRRRGSAAEPSAA